MEIDDRQDAQMKIPHVIKLFVNVSWGHVYVCISHTIDDRDWAVRAYWIYSMPVPITTATY